MIRGRRFEALGRDLSRIVLGTAYTPAELELIPEIADRYVELGGNVIDTARSYGSEEAVGRWLETSGADRSSVIVITKGAHPVGDYAIRRVSPDAIDEDLARSLEALRIDAVDLYFLHRDDPAVPVGSLLETLERHRLDGRIRAYGGSNWTIPRLEEAAAYARDHGLAGFSASSPHLSLAIQVADAWPGGVSAADDASRAWYTESGMPLVAWSALARGWFADAQAADSEDWTAGDTRRVYDSPINRERRQRARSLARQLGLSTATVALAWVLHQSFPTWAVVGPRSLDELDASGAAANLDLTPDQIAFLELG